MTTDYVIVTRTGEKDHRQTNKATTDGYRAKCGVTGRLVREGDGKSDRCQRCKWD